MSTKLLIYTTIGFCLSASAFAGSAGTAMGVLDSGGPLGDSAPLLGVAAIVLVAGIQYLRNKRS